MTFEEKEKLSRDKTRNLFTKYELVDSPDRYSVWDMSGCTATNITEDYKNFFIEIKERNVESYAFDTIYLEWDKYKSLLHVAAQHDADVFYLNYYKDGCAYIHNLTKLNVQDLNLIIKEAPAKSELGERININKIFIELPFGGAKKLKY